jgi:hypothetical protein
VRNVSERRCTVNYVAFEIMWKNIKQPERAGMTIWRIRCAWWIVKDTNTQSEYVTTYYFSVTTMVSR